MGVLTHKIKSLALSLAVLLGVWTHNASAQFGSVAGEAFIVPMCAKLLAGTPQTQSHLKTVDSEFMSHLADSDSGAHCRSVLPEKLVANCQKAVFLINEDGSVDPDKFTQLFGDNAFEELFSDKVMSQYGRCRRDYLINSKQIETHLPVSTEESRGTPSTK